MIQSHRICNRRHKGEEFKQMLKFTGDGNQNRIMIEFDERKREKKQEPEER